MARIIYNGVHCNVCNTTIESTSRHDFKACRCGMDSESVVYVDGGHAYIRRGIGKLADFDELSIYEEEVASEAG